MCTTSARSVNLAIRAQHTQLNVTLREQLYVAMCNGEIARRSGIRRGEEVDFRAELSFL